MKAFQRGVYSPSRHEFPVAPLPGKDRKGEIGSAASGRFLEPIRHSKRAIGPWYSISDCFDPRVCLVSQELLEIFPLRLKL